jgi:sigma-B regulation protein RsbU (phosphoserine phosphatase)
MAWLVALDPLMQGRRFTLDAPVLIGRGPINHIVIDDPRISRQHAKVTPEEGGHVIYDLNSANGTFVNSMSIKRHKLQPRDVVHVGPFRFSFEESISGVVSVPEPPGFQQRGEMRTVHGMDAPTRIVDSMDAISMAAPGAITRLSELEDSDRKLRTLLAFMQSVSGALEGGALVELIVTNLFEVFAKAETIALYLRDDPSASLTPRVSMRRDRSSAPVTPLSVQVVGEVVQKGRAILSTPIVPATPSRKSPAGLTMHAPMINRGAVEGVLEVNGQLGAGPMFTQRDLDMLAGLAAMAAMSLHNARIHIESLKQQRVQQDLLLAREIQQSFLPQQIPVAAHTEIATEYRPAFTVGGDFYDLFYLNERQLCFFIGDVAGKGVSAALLMARLSSDLRLAALAEQQPARALEVVNRSMLERGQHDIFTTAVCMTLDVETGTVLLSNAGHVPPLLRRGGDGIVEPILGGSGTALGFFEGEEFPQARFDLEPGDALLLCTDGVLEAANPHGEAFGLERLQVSMQGGALSAAELAQRVLMDLSLHVREAPQYDDITLMVLGRV